MAATLALAMCLLGCGGLLPDGSQVRLLTGPPGGNGGGCFTDSASGPLVFDPTYGTAIIDRDVGSSSPMTVAWRPGFTARRIATEVEVLDPAGNVVAITGRNYRIAGGYVNAGGSSGLVWPELPIDVFWACDSVIPQP